MDQTRMDSHSLANIQRWSTALMVLASVGIAFVVLSIIEGLIGERLVLAIPTADGVRLLTEHDFGSSQRWILISIGSLPDLCWIFCLTQIIRMSRLFSRGQLLTLPLMDCLQRFSFALLVQAIAELVVGPLLVFYLIRTGKVDSVQGIWSMLLGGGAITSLTASIFVLMIARILRIGIRLREDAELTI